MYSVSWASENVNHGEIKTVMVSQNVDARKLVDSIAEVIHRFFLITLLEYGIILR